MAVMESYAVAYDDYDDYAPVTVEEVGAEVTYTEIRRWAVWLDLFTASDLADAMGVDHAIGAKGIKALLWHGICEDTGELLDGTYGPEPVISYVPLPPGPTEHPHGTLPEIIAVMQMGGFEIFQPRGMPVRIRNDRDTRQNLSTPGARHKMKLSEQRYQSMIDAQERRRQEQVAKARAAKPTAEEARRIAKAKKRSAKKVEQHHAVVV